jgi:site-specific DNA-methyltransferase (adenine-specific)
MSFEYEIQTGDVMETLKFWPDNMFDACLTDPPYGLSKGEGAQRVSNRIFDALAKVGFPNLYDMDSKFFEQSQLAGVTPACLDLRREYRTSRERAGIGVPKGSVHLNNVATIEQKVHNSAESAGSGISDVSLPGETHPASDKFLGDFLLDLRDMMAIASGSYERSGCVAETFSSGFAVPIVIPQTAGDDSLDARGFPVTLGDHLVRSTDDTLCETKGPSGIMTLPGTVNTLMLRFDLSGTPAELLPTYRASIEDGIGELSGPKLVRALSGTGSLSTVAKPYSVRFVFTGADGTRSDYYFHLWIPKDYVFPHILPTGGFMGKQWDSHLPDPEVWREVLRVMKPGAHMLVFGGVRTHHRLMCAIEDAGFEIRELLMWLFGSGFPKSHNLKGKFEGYGTALKPAWEPILLAMKPCDGTFAGNALKWGVAGLAIDAARIDARGDKLGGGRVSTTTEGWDRPWKHDPKAIEECRKRGDESVRKAEAQGRWPANVLLDEEAATALDLQSGVLSSGAKDMIQSGWGANGIYGSGQPHRKVSVADSGGASRFFYVSKAPRSEREAGLHPTVKPVKLDTQLAAYLLRLILPPANENDDRRLLVPFCGSGSEMIGAREAGWEYVLGIDSEPKYVEIAERRLSGYKSSRTSLRTGLTSARG